MFYDFGVMVIEECMLCFKYYEVKIYVQFFWIFLVFLIVFFQNIDENINVYVDLFLRNLMVIMSFDVEGRKIKFFFIRYMDVLYMGEIEYIFNFFMLYGDVKVLQFGGKLLFYGCDMKVYVVDYQVGDYLLFYFLVEVFILFVFFYFWRIILVFFDLELLIIN